MHPSPLLHFSVQAALGSSLSDNVMITVDIVPSGRTSDGQESEKTEDSSRDLEKLKKIKESFLLEDSEEEEGGEYVRLEHPVQVIPLLSHASVLVACNIFTRTV